MFSVGVSHVANSPSAVVTVEHKNFADTSWVSAAAFTAITTTGQFDLDVSGLKEQVRLAIAITAASAVAAIHIIINAPSWRYY